MSLDIEILYPRALSDRSLSGQDASSFTELVERLQRFVRRPNPFSLDDRFATLEGLSDRLLQGEDRTYPGLAFLAAFLRSAHLKHLLQREIPNLAAIDRFVATEDRKSLFIAPRGVVTHWIAGNVPLLGMFSWALSALLGNANVLRMSSRQDPMLVQLIDQLADLSDCGQSMAERTVVVRCDRDDEAAHRSLSECADARVAWGGKEAVEAIRALPARWDCEDIVLGPRVSLAVVDPALITDKIVTRLATDIAYFDQLACSSPQCIFVKSADDASVEKFVQAFVPAFERQSRAIARHTLDFAETYQISLDRTRVLVEGGELWRDQQTQWTVAVVPELHREIVCANRFVQIVPFREFDEVCRQIPQNIQTIITLLNADDTNSFTTAAALCGVCRFPRPGEGNNFEIPWDGIALASRLTRWITRSDPPTENST
ncbi:MAG: hypothetical protein KDA42_06640 [Planctomycetales bacterium]|nr:hypothetical protein [Planctomycetales bacterium]